ncbi:MAG: S8 family peptidase [Sphingobacteriaceae bacterium]|nr:S8 family peptidase [Sphingobacteriaceae bacterium]
MNRFFTLFLSICLVLTLGLSQAQELTRPQQWYQLDPRQDQLGGISTNKAYESLLADRLLLPVIVAVIDAGVDIEHEDLKEVLWVNPREIPDNGIDDDGNGYIDDVYGWSFLSGPGGEVHYDTYEMTRELVKYSALEKDGKIAKGSKEAAYLKELRKKHKAEVKEMSKAFKVMSELKAANDAFLTEVGREGLTEAKIDAFKPKGKWQKVVKGYYGSAVKNKLPIVEAETKLLEGYEQVNGMLNYGLNLEFNPRHLVGDKYEEWNDAIYGDNRVTGPDASHGTHVAGIIAAQRNNGKGMNGIAANARIMTLRAVPSGDEHDKDVANAIRYAVNNGAKVINMSFGKSYSPQSELVAAAVEYAASKDVLLVHAAGNDGKNIDEANNFPQPFAPGGEKYQHWLEVGASSFQLNERMLATFSNYGKESVDVFAPGDHIYATMPGSKYDHNSGTSMAAPVVAGIAAVIRGLYPQLTAPEVRNIIMESTYVYEQAVILPGSKKKKTTIGDISRTGGVVNLEAAILLADKKVAAR